MLGKYLIWLVEWKKSSVSEAEDLSVTGMDLTQWGDPGIWCRARKILFTYEKIWRSHEIQPHLFQNLI